MSSTRRAKAGMLLFCCCVCVTLHFLALVPPVDNPDKGGKRTARKKTSATKKNKTPINSPDISDTEDKSPPTATTTTTTTTTTTADPLMAMPVYPRDFQSLKGKDIRMPSWKRIINDLSCVKSLHLKKMLTEWIAYDEEVDPRELCLTSMLFHALCNITHCTSYSNTATHSTTHHNTLHQQQTQQ
jgi:hypothetical protein